MSNTHQGKLQRLPQFRAELMTATGDYDTALLYQAMPVEELTVLAELRNQQNDLALARTGELMHPYVDLSPR